MQIYANVTFGSHLTKILSNLGIREVSEQHSTFYKFSPVKGLLV